MNEAQEKFNKWWMSFCKTAGGGATNMVSALDIAQSAWEAALAEKPAERPLRDVLEKGITLVESAFAHVSHGGPTRADAEKWLKEAKNAIGE